MIVDDVPTSGLGGFRLGVSGGKLYFEIHDSSGTVYSNQSVSGGTSLTSGSWYQLVGQFDASSGTINTYVNDSLDRSASVSGTMGASYAQTFLIGRQRSPGTNFLNGTVDDFQVFSRALSPTEIGELPAGVSDGLEAYLKFDEGTGNRTFDSANSAGVKLDLTNLPVHTQLTVTFDLYIIETWDGRAGGNYGPDIWSLTEDGNTLLYTTFANGNTAGQSYPGTFPTSRYAKQTGASAVNTLGYMNGSTPSDSTYHLSYTFDHTDSSVVLNFFGSELENLSDESWGLDNVVVTSTPATAVSASADVVNEGSPYTLNLFSGSTSTTGWSIDWGDGSDVQSVTGDPSSVQHTYVDDGDYTVSASATYGGTAHTAASITASILNPPDAPSGLTATAVSDSQIDLAWTDNADDNTGFEIDWSANGSDFAPLTTLDSAITSYEAMGLTGGTSYQFQVIATADNGQSTPSAEATATTLPLAPTGLSAADSPDGTVTITWNPVASALDYDLERRKGTDGEWTPIAPAIVGISYTDDGGDHDSVYYFRIRARNTTGDSDYSATISNSFIPPSPTNVDWTDGILSWTPGPSTVKSYDIEFSTGGINFSKYYYGYNQGGLTGYEDDDWADLTDVSGICRVRSTSDAAQSAWVYVKQTLTLPSEGALENAIDGGFREGTASAYLDAQYTVVGISLDGHVLLDLQEYIPQPEGYDIQKLTGSDPGNDADWETVQHISGGSQTVELSAVVGDETPYRIRDEHDSDAFNFDVGFDLLSPGPIGAPFPSSTSSAHSIATSFDTDGNLLISISDPGQNDQIYQQGDFFASTDQIHWMPLYATNFGLSNYPWTLTYPTPGLTPYTVDMINGSFYVKALLPDGWSNTSEIDTDSTTTPPTNLTASIARGGFDVSWTGTPYEYWELQVSGDGEVWQDCNLYDDWGFLEYSPGHYQVVDFGGDSESLYKYFRVRPLPSSLTDHRPISESQWTSIEANNADVELTPHRTGGNFGQAVSRDIQDGGNPADYVVLVNDDYEEHPDMSAPDDADNTALIQNDQAETDANGNPIDDDLVKLTLSQFPSGLTDGTYTLTTSDNSAVRFFDDNGQELTNLSFDLANPSGYLSGLMSHDVDVWMEGKAPDPDLRIGIQYTDPQGNIISWDAVHMLLAEWKTIGTDGNDAQVANVDLDNVRAEADGDPTVMPSGPDPSYSYQFKTLIDGLPSSDIQELRTTSDDDPSDYFIDTVGSNSSATESSNYSALYFDTSESPLTSDERAEIASTLQLDLVHNQSATTQATTQGALDVQKRTVALNARQTLIARLQDLENVHKNTLYYKPTGLSQLFPLLTNVANDPTLTVRFAQPGDDVGPGKSAAAAYIPGDRILIVTPGMDSGDALRELHRALSDKMQWHPGNGNQAYIDDSAMEWGLWWMLEVTVKLRALEKLKPGLQEYEQAQALWQQTWDVRGFMGIYQNPIPLDQNGTSTTLETAANIWDINAKYGALFSPGQGLRFSCGQLRSIYENMLAAHGITNSGDRLYPTDMTPITIPKGDPFE